MSGQHEAVKPSTPSTPASPAAPVSLEKETRGSIPAVVVSLDKETRRASPAPFTEVRIATPKSVPPFTAPKTTAQTTEEANREGKREIEREQTKIRMSGSFDKMMLTGAQLNNTVKRLIQMNYLVMVTHFFLAVVMLYVVVHMSRDMTAVMQELHNMQTNHQHEGVTHVAR